LKMEAIRSSETSVNTISIRRHIPEDCFLHDQYRPKADMSYSVHRLPRFLAPCDNEASPCFRQLWIRNT
jgi:hypothetical protein